MVIDGPTRKLIANVHIDGDPGGVAVDSGSGTVYITNGADGTMSVIDGSTREVTATFRSVRVRGEWRWIRTPTPFTSPTATGFR